MRLLPIAPFAILILVGQAALEAMPAVIAMREGGMGLGSALILGQAAQVAAVAVGAAAAAYLVDRRSAPAALLPGALLFGAGLISVGLQPLGELIWVLLAQILAGTGFGIILTASFAAAATMAGGVRPLAIALLLLAPLAARSVIGVLFTGGPVVLTVAAGIVLATSWMVVRLPHAFAVEWSTGGLAASEPGRVALSGRGAALGGLLTGFGVLATIVGADASRVSAAQFAAPFGLAQLEVLDALRAGMLLTGLFLLLGGAALLLRGQHLHQRTLAALLALLLAALAGSGIGAALRFAAPTGGIVPGERAISVVGAAVLTGAALGILLGGLWVVRSGRPQVVATAGSAVLACATVLGVAALAVPIPGLGALVPLAALLAVIGLGGGIAVSVLRLLLADAPSHQLSLAAAAGVVAASFGSALGTTIGNSEGVGFVTGETGAISPGLLLLAAAAAAAAIFAWRAGPARREVRTPAV